MRLRLLTAIAGVDFTFYAGDETDRFVGEEARRLVESGAAVPVSDETIERTIKPPVAERRKKGG